MRLEYYIADNALSRTAEALAKDAEVKGTEGKHAAARRMPVFSITVLLGYKYYYSKEYGTFRPISAER